MEKVPYTDKDHCGEGICYCPPTSAQLLKPQTEANKFIRTFNSINKEEFMKENNITESQQVKVHVRSYHKRSDLP